MVLLEVDNVCGVAVEFLRHVKSLVRVSKCDSICPVLYVLASVAVASGGAFVDSPETTGSVGFDFRTNQVVPDVFRASLTEYRWLCASFFAVL